MVPPPEIVAQGLEAIRRYWLQERDAGVDYLTEAKLLVVGESGAGKTSLAKKILDPDYELDKRRGFHRRNRCHGVAVPDESPGARRGQRVFPPA